MDATQLAQLLFKLKAADNALTLAFNAIKQTVDVGIYETRTSMESILDTVIFPGLVLKSNDFMALIKADKKTQDVWLKQFEKGLGLSPKRAKETKETREDTVNKARGRQPSAEQMYQKMISKKGLNF